MLHQPCDMDIFIPNFQKGELSWRVLEQHTQKSQNKMIGELRALPLQQVVGSMVYRFLCASVFDSSRNDPEN